MKSIRTVLFILLACAGGYGCTGLQRFMHGHPIVSGAPEINDNVFLLRNGGEDEVSYTDTGKVIPAPCTPFMDSHHPTPNHLAQINLCVYAMHGLIDVRWHRFEHELS